MCGWPRNFRAEIVIFVAPDYQCVTFSRVARGGRVDLSRVSSNQHGVEARTESLPLAYIAQEEQ